MTMISMNAMTLMKVITNTHVEIGKLQALMMHFARTIVISLEKKKLISTQSPAFVVVVAEAGRHLNILQQLHQILAPLPHDTVIYVFRRLALTS